MRTVSTKVGCQFIEFLFLALKFSQSLIQYNKEGWVSNSVGLMQEIVPMNTYFVVLLKALDQQIFN